MDLDSLWENYQNSGTFAFMNEKKDVKKESPKCSDIYISTKTKIAYLNSEINLINIFWKIPIIKYENPSEGVIKKQIKINSLNENEVKILEEKISQEENISCEIIQQINNPNARKNKFKDIRKINIGCNTKDLISYRKKKKGAFYNCFALILRIFYEDKFKEIHIKVFNTGKLEIPGIQTDKMLFMALDKLLTILQPFVKKKLLYIKNKIQTVLINSNFNCNYVINRNKLYDILKFKYGITTLYDPCSYPGIQCKFYYNDNNIENKGICTCKKKCVPKNKKCYIVSFMIFRTGSVLIVGQCNEDILNKIYKFISNILINEYDKISIKNSTNNFEIKKKKKKKRKKKIIIYSTK
tara:strand:- start:2455 stop:3513 length:1059 start_codon:yes stop_codon:yes gene_type:complete